MVARRGTLGAWLAGGGGTDFQYTTSDEDEGPTLALASTAGAVWRLSSSFVHEPGSFGGEQARVAARKYIRELERRLLVLGHSMSRCPPPGVPVDEWNAMLSGMGD